MSDTSPIANGDDRAGQTRQTFFYFGWLTLFLYMALPHGYLLDFQTSYLLKNQLEASPNQISLFRFITAIPACLAIAFGLLRDVWNPLGMRDRGYFLIFAPAAAILFLVMAYVPVSFVSLYAGMFLSMLLFRFIAAAYQGLMALVGQEKLMSGRLAVLWNVVNSVPTVAGGLASGYISAYLDPSMSFLLAAGFTLCIGLIGFWTPRAVFRHAYDKPQAKGSSIGGDIKRLLKHRAVYPAVLCMFLWSFAPGPNTPLQFYLSDQLKLSDAVFSYYWAIFAASFVPTFLLYGFLCTKVSLKKLLWWGTIVAIPQMIPLLFIDSAKAALIWAVPIGMMGGVATAAYYDLAMRACPPGMQGTLMMAVDGVYLLAARGGDMLGTAIYNHDKVHGFLYCVIATTAVYALILPVLLLAPKELIATADGEPNPAIEAEMMKEIEETA
jgi:hypothetical protein